MCEIINEDMGVDGLIVQLPLPEHLNEQEVIETIDPNKDVDGFHPINMGRMLLVSVVCSATPAGIVDLLDYYHIPLQGKECVIVGRSNIVGKPLANLLQKGIQGDCTVTLCHSRTDNLPEVARRADILIAAIGRPLLIKEDWVKEELLS